MTKQIPATGDNERVILNSLEAEYLKGTQKGHYCWNHTPAQIELLSAADQWLTKVSEQRGMPVTEVTLVRVALVPAKKMLYIYPADENDPEGIQVNRWDSSAWINAITVLGPAKLTAKRGRRNLHAVMMAGEESPVGPALQINLARVIQSKTEPVKSKAKTAAAAKAKQAAPKAETTAPAQAEAGAEPQGGKA